MLTTIRPPPSRTVRDADGESLDARALVSEAADVFTTSPWGQPSLEQTFIVLALLPPGVRRHHSPRGPKTTSVVSVQFN